MQFGMDSTYLNFTSYREHFSQDIMQWRNLGDRNQRGEISALKKSEKEMRVSS